MNAETIPSCAAEINRLHETVQALSVQSRKSLDASLVSAWQAGQLLIAEKKRVRLRMGPSSWMLWLEARFHGAPRTAQRYMKLARSIADVTFLKGMSLRQAYAQLDIATEPKTPGRCPLMHQLPAHVVLANRLVRVLKQERKRAGENEKTDAIRRDSRALFEALRPWFAGHPSDERRENSVRIKCP